MSRWFWKHYFESAEWLRSRDSLRSSLALLVAVFAHGCAVRTGRGALRLAACIVRLPAAGRPFHPHPRWL